MKKVKYKGEELVITYRNDVIFKRTLASNDEISREILTFILEAVTGRTYRNVTVTNSESLGRHALDKRHYLDIRAEDEEGNIFNIEMQQAAIGEYDMKRFQGYNYRIVGGQLDKGQSYKNMKPSVQIVFTSEKFRDQLVTEYRQRTSEGEDMEHNLASFYFISLPEIDRIIEEKRRTGEKLTNLETVTHIYHNGSKRAIIDIVDERQKRVVELMEDKYEESTSKMDVLDEATLTAYYEEYLEEKYKHYLQSGLEEGLKEGLQQGMQQGIQQGIQQGMQKGVYKEALLKTQRLIKQFYDEDTNWLDNCSLEQLNKAFDLALQNIEYNELKQQVLK